uniref:Carbamoyl phosphate synthase arginine-specific large chain n=1 Tax=Globodera rostochiensis TaxID=31243 RepID=A0A914HQW9_GLORO
MCNGGSSDSDGDFEWLNAFLCFEDGTRMRGRLFGAARSVAGELVFQTGMVGYVESLTDPSYAQQLLVLTNPLVGNYGVPDDTRKDPEWHQLPTKSFESGQIWPAALVVDRICPEGEHSHWEAVQSLSKWLRKAGVPGLAGLDTRLLTKRIREHGTLKAKLVLDSDDPERLPFVDINAENLVAKVSRKCPEWYGDVKRCVSRILVVDCGLKNNQIRCLLQRGCAVHVVPWDWPIDQHSDDYDGIFVSNGPGNPEMCAPLVERLKRILRDRPQQPLFGICLGHQLLARAAGATTYKLSFGNRGHNQPCVHTDTGRCFITAQNHGFAVDAKSLDGTDWTPLFVNANDGTNEGIVHNERPQFSVQFHPEHCAGPTDMECLFDVFLQAVQLVKQQGQKTFCVRQLISDRFSFNAFYRERLPPQRKVLILGSGGLSIGQAGEFDYSGAQAIKALKEMGLRTVLVNPNVATVQTTKGFADRVYFLPVTKEYVTEVIKKERPSGILCTFGGQTALNCAIDLHNSGILSEYAVTVLGTPIETIMRTEDRDLFKEFVLKIGEKVADCRAANTIEEAEKAAEQIGYPVLVRAAYALGGLGSGFAESRDELVSIARQALAHSKQVLIDKSFQGWKEIEYEVVRDAYDNCITVCNMENVDPLGIHTGESVVVAPSQTLNNEEYFRLRETALKVIRGLGVIGECNIQYALNPLKMEYFIVEVNARLSRSSALASKATGYPLAYIAAKLALGESLATLRNSVTRDTTACFEPSLDYCVVKVPRWDLAKFADVNRKIGSSMKSVGEVMAIGRSFEEALQKAFRMVNDHNEGFSPHIFKDKVTEQDLRDPTDKRMFAIARAFYNDEPSPHDNFVEYMHNCTRIDRWFLYRMRAIIDMYRTLEAEGMGQHISSDLLRKAKQFGFSDFQIATCINSNEEEVHKLRRLHAIVPAVKQIDTVAAEWPAKTNYLYLTYNGTEHDVQFEQKSNSVIVLGSGVYRIGSSVEFDACAVGCVQELKRLGFKTVMVNCNPETVSTDYDMCDRLYFEEISLEVVSGIYENEHPNGIILAFGGQAANNIALALQLASPNLCVPIKVFGTAPSFVDKAEDRFKFSRALDELKIAQPKWKNAKSVEEAVGQCSAEVGGYPCLIRPSYVLSGAAMKVAHNEEDLRNFLSEAALVARDKPVDAKEIDVDVVAIGGRVLVSAISEHVENAGIHSGDATLITPPQDLNESTTRKIGAIIRDIANHFSATGPFNLQLIAKDDNLFVIECNLRVSRSFPFISKTLDIDFVALATRAMMWTQPSSEFIKSFKRPQLPINKVGVKVPQFSFSRLAGADVVMGVEMLSTGEVACFGRTRQEAYLKGLLSTGFQLPKRVIFLSIGYKQRAEMLESVRLLDQLGFTLYGSKGTADYYASDKIRIKNLEWPFEEKDNYHVYGAKMNTVAQFVEKKIIDFMIILPICGSGAYRPGAYRTHGYNTRRMAIDNGIPLITDIKCAKLFITALSELYRLEHPIFTNGARLPPMDTHVDCLSSESLVRLPGLIDVHVHMREPGGEYKETWESGTRAAIAGGVTMVLAMPNTQPPLVDEQSFELVEQLASRSALCDYALYMGATAQNVALGAHLAPKCAGLKMYLNETFAALRLHSVEQWMEHLRQFPADRPVVVHAEGQTLAALLFAANVCKRDVHVAHVARAEEIALICAARKAGQWGLTCEVCPHHLFFTEDALPEGVREVRPRLATTRADCDALWRHLDDIDCFATDHAPHTYAEKCSDRPPPGFPGIEFMLPLLLHAVTEGRLTMQQLVERLYDNPRRIFELPEQPDTYIEVDMNEKWTIPESGGWSKAGWTPFAGRQVCGRVCTVVIRGHRVYDEGRFLCKPGFGHNVRLLAPGTVESLPAAERLPATISSNKKFGAKDKDNHGAKVQRISPDQSPDRTCVVGASRLYGQHILCVDQFDKETVEQVLKLAKHFEEMAVRSFGPNGEHLRPSAFGGPLRDFSISLLFFEPSTRTMYSFDDAMRLLGGTVSIFNAEHSSVKKGETLEDTIITRCHQYTDLIVLRHPQCGSSKRASSVSCGIPIINAGDGSGEHPTQALLDLQTIKQKLSSIHEKTVAMVGDLRNGRTVHSLAKLLSLYRKITLHYVSPPGLGMPDAVKQYVEDNGHDHEIVQKEFTSLEEGIRGVDVIYMTRIQRERFENVADYEAVRGTFVLTPKVLNACCRDQVLAWRPHQPTPIIMHPLPRNDELSTELDMDRRAVYFQQMRYGLYVRMALLQLILCECC